MLSDSNLTWMKFPTENTGLGMFWPQSLNSAAPSSDATLVIKTRAPPGEPVQSVCWFGSNVKLRKVNLIISPAGTVIVEVHSVFRGKLFGKFGLVRNPLVPARSPSPHSAAKQNTSAWPHGKKSDLYCQYCLSYSLLYFIICWKKEQYRDGSRISQGLTQPNEIFLRMNKQAHFHEKRRPQNRIYRPHAGFLKPGIASTQTYYVGTEAKLKYAWNLN